MPLGGFWFISPTMRVLPTPFEPLNVMPPLDLLRSCRRRLPMAICSFVAVTILELGYPISWVGSAGGQFLFFTP